MSLNPIYIDATTLPDAWFQTLYSCVEHGNKFKIDRGSYAGQERLEFDYITVRVKHPGAQPLVPQVPAHYGFPNPVADNYLDDYLPYLMTGEIAEGESYTYGSRMCKQKLFEGETSKRDLTQWKEIYIQDEIQHLLLNEYGSDFLSQIDLLIWTYKNKGYRNNQMVLQVAQPSDMMLQDPPCLRHIDTRIQEGALHFFPYFRSWDLFGGFPANLAGIQMMKEYVAAEIGVEDGEIIAASKGLHIYDYTWEIAECLRGRTIDEFNGE
jgi:thymidylate synthase